MLKNQLSFLFIPLFLCIYAPSCAGPPGFSANIGAGIGGYYGGAGGCIEGRFLSGSNFGISIAAGAIIPTISLTFWTPFFFPKTTFGIAAHGGYLPNTAEPSEHYNSNMVIVAGANAVVEYDVFEPGGVMLRGGL